MMKRLLAAATLIVAAIGVILVVGNDRAAATSSIMSSFVSRYSPSSKLASCTTCHNGTPSISTLNPYGRALMNAGVSFAAIESVDSDGDGVSNLAEIQAGTFPGDASDKPATTTTTASTTTTTASTTTTTASTTTTTASTTTTTASTTTTTASTTTTTSPAAAGQDAGGTAFSAGDAGTVWLLVQDGRLIVTRVETTWAYTQKSEDGEVEIVFRSEDREVELEAELEDGTIKVKVEGENGDCDESDHRDDRDGEHQGENNGERGQGGAVSKPATTSFFWRRLPRASARVVLGDAGPTDGL
jgi:cytoskeletal protein RodZ